MKILVVCGAGASSSFVALRIRRSARDRGIAVEVVPTSESQLEQLAPGVDVVLLGAHLAGGADDIRSRIAADVVVLPESAFTDSSGDTALELALDAAGIRP
jgi:PTS system cellobiose-specific IIB component